MKLLLRLFLAAALIFSAHCPSASPAAPKLSITVLKNIVYRGLGTAHHAIHLKNGRWQGERAAAGSASLVTADLIGDFAAYGDLDGDGVDEAVVLLRYSSGGSGVFTYVAVVKERQGQPQNIVTKFIGDRVQVRDITIRDQRLIADMIVAGPDDPLCCPSQKVQGRWKLSGRSLSEVATVVSGKLAVADVGTNEWLLARWAEGESELLASGITLGFREGRFVGFGGCNQYFVGVSDGPQPGQIGVSSLAGATRKACEEPVMTRETRFLAALAKVTRFSFLPGGLAMTYDSRDGKSKMLLFAKRRGP